MVIDEVFCGIYGEVGDDYVCNELVGVVFY